MSQLSSKGLSPTCPLCKLDFDIYYRTPRVVPKCGHTYCQKCISNRLTIKSNRKVFLCPECTSEVIIRKGVQEDVPKNIGIIDIVKNLKKYSTNDKQDERKNGSDTCIQHQRPLELVCETCSFKKICSHCVLFGQHHAHNYRKEAPASSLNLKQLKEVFDLVAGSVKLVLLPDSQNNLKQTMKTKISEGLKKSVKANFKQYYDMIEKKEFQLLQECDNIVITQGGIDNSIDKLVQEYDKLKNRYDMDWNMVVQHGNGKVGKVATVSNIDQFIGKCEDLHSRVVSIQDQAMQHVDKMLKDIGVRLSQAVMFKIQELSFSVKKIVEGLGKQQKQMTSPQRKARLKSTTSQIKSRSVIAKDEGPPQHPSNNDRIDRNTNKSQCKSVIAKKTKNNYSQIDKEEIPQDDFSILQPGKSDIRNVKEQTQNHKQLKELISNKYVSNGERGSLPPKASKPKINDFDSKTVNLKQVKEQDKGKGLMKDLSPAKTVSLFNKQTSSFNSVQSLNEQLKFVRPTKEISFQLLSKFQEIMVQTDRQAEQNTLQLVSLDINDILLLYLLDYLRVKKHRFQVIKFVKNLITDEGFRIILGFLVGDNTTQLLNMTSNQLTAKSLDLIVQFAQKNNTLKTIYLGGNKVSSVHLKSKKNQLNKYELEIVI